MPYLEAYIDESGTHSGSPVVCLAGYLFTPDEREQFESEWSQVLAAFGLPYFRMSDCAHGNGPFSGLTKEQRVVVETQCIEIIKARSVFGFAATVNEVDFNEIYRPLSQDSWTAYHFCLTNCLVTVAHFLRTQALDAKVVFAFEAGHRDQSKASTILANIFDSDELQRQFFYASHAFAGKTERLPLQAADLLAWQWFTHKKKKLQGAARDRADLVALMRPQDNAMDFDREKLVEAAQAARTNIPKMRAMREGMLD